jgi:hypothetical protein
LPISRSSVKTLTGVVSAESFVDVPNRRTWAADLRFHEHRQDVRQFACTGTMVEPSGMSASPQTVVMTLGPAQKVTLDLGNGVVNARRVRDNKIQLKFRTKEFEGEYFHYTGDLFFIYKTGRLMKLMCEKRAV